MNTRHIRHRRIGVALAALCGLGLLALAAYQATRPQPVTSTSDTYYAQLAANMADERVEVRSEYGKTFDVGNNTYALHLSQERIHYLDPQTGQWQPIDTRFVVSAAADWNIAATKNKFRVFVRPQPTDGDMLVRYELGDAQVEFGLEAEQPWGRMRSVSAQVEGNQVTYPGLFPGMDLRLTVKRDQLLEELIVRDRAYAERIVAVHKRFRATNVRYEQRPTGAIAFVDGAGRTLFHIPPPVLYELGNAANRSTAVRYEVLPQANYVALVKRLGAEAAAWMRSQAGDFVIDESVDLNDSQLTGFGDGFVRKNATIQGSCDLGGNGTYDEFHAESANRIGCYEVTVNNYAVARAYFEWSTATVDPGIKTKIKSLGVYLNGTASYASQIRLTKLTQASSVYGADAGGLWTDIGDAVPGDGQYATVGRLITAANYYNLGCRPAVSGVCDEDAIVDFENSLGVSNMFYFGTQATVEGTTNLYGTYTAADSGDAGLKPDLVVFYDHRTATYSAVAGTFDPPARPLRDAIWDGAYHWVFFTPSDGSGIQYAYLSDGGTTWSAPINFAPPTDANSRHFAVWGWRAGTTTYVALAYHSNNPGAAPDVGEGPLKVNVGTISGTSITWQSSSSTVFSSGAGAGYDFPSITRDSAGYCWVTSRYGPSSQPYAYSQVLARSTDTTCSAWTTQFTVYGPQSVTTQLDFRSTGGYVVPLTNGYVYVVFKSRDSSGNTNPLYGRRCYYTTTITCDGTGPEQIDDNNNTMQGVYTYGMSAVAIGDEVDVLYVDCRTGDSCSTPTLTDLKFACRNPSPVSWTRTTVVDGLAVIHNPSLTRRDLGASTAHMYALFRSDRKLGDPAPVKHSATGAVYYAKGMYGGTCSYSWPPNPTTLTTGIWGLWAPVDVTVSGYSLFSNYSTLPLSGSATHRIISAWVEGAFGLDTALVLNP